MNKKYSKEEEEEEDIPAEEDIEIPSLKTLKQPDWEIDEYVILAQGQREKALRMLNKGIMLRKVARTFGFHRKYITRLTK